MILKVIFVLALSTPNWRGKGYCIFV